MGLTIFEKPFVVEKDRIVERFNEGGYIYCKEVPYLSEYVLVLAKQTLDDRKEPREYFRDIYDVLDDEYKDENGEIPMTVIKVEEAPKKYIFPKGLFYCDFTTFYEDAVEYFEVKYHRLKLAYGTLPEEMAIFFAEDEDNDIICLGWAVVSAENEEKEIEEICKEIESVRGETDITIMNLVSYKQKAYSVQALELASDGKGIQFYDKELNRKWKNTQILKKRMERDKRRRNAGEAFGGPSPVPSPKRKRGLEEDIKNWLLATRFPDFFNSIADRVMGQKNLLKVLVGVYNYLSNISEGKPVNCNQLLAAPSGSGKTETFRALRDYFHEKLPKLPVYQIDMTQITEEGFKGPDTKDILRPLFQYGPSKGIGLVFLDEFDKKLLPSFTSGGNDVNAAIQAQILTLLEGREIEVEVNPMVRENIDTTNTMFIGLGSFDVTRNRRAVTKGSIGFGATVGDVVTDHYKEITRQDMIELGASYELLGRFPSVICYNKLDEKTVNLIIDRDIIRVADMLKVKVSVTDQRRQTLLELANGKYGLRMLFNEIYDQTMGAYGDVLMSGKSLEDIVVTLETDGKYTVSRQKRRRTKKEVPENSNNRAGNDNKKGKCAAGPAA